METNICKRFSEELLINKNVRIQQGLFRSLHKQIFPEKDLFVDFLKPQMQEETVALAKKIFARLQFTLTYPIPKIFSDNLLHIESSTDDLASDFIAQDHYVHSIYLYLVGIYLYFNHETIHAQIHSQFTIKQQTILNPFSNPYCESILAFVRSWTYFSLYHDLGYAFEKPLCERNGKVIIDERITEGIRFFDVYNHLPDYISYELALNTLSRYLLFESLLTLGSTQNPNVTQQELSGWNLLKRRSRTPENCSASTITTALASYSHYVMLPKVASSKNLTELIPFIDTNKLIAFVYNKYGVLSAIYTPEATFFSSQLNDFSTEKLHKLYLLGCSEAPEMSFYCTYYFEKNQESSASLLQDIGLYAFLPSLPEAISNAIKENSHLFSFLTPKSDLSTTRYNLYTYLAQRFPHKDLDHDYVSKLEEQHSHNIKNIIKNTVDDIAQQYYQKLDSYEKQGQLFKEPELTNIIEEYMRIAEQLNPTKIINTISQSKELQLSAYETLANSLQKIRGQIREKNEINLRFVKFERCNQTYIEFKPLNVQHLKYMNNKQINNCYKECYSSLEKHLIISLKQLGFLKPSEKLNVFFQYRPPYTCVDHGIVSASLLANSLFIYQSFCKNMPPQAVCAALNNYRTASPTEDIDAEIKLIWENPFFAILIHNIYNERYYQNTGNRYMQRLDINAFSYLGALCDSLQFWNRHRQYNPSSHDYVPVFYAGDSDIEINGDTINITCIADSVDSAGKNRRTNLQEFLQDISSIINLNIKERYIPHSRL